MTTTRIVLTDGTGRWFKEESAIQFRESSTWNGSNNISDATGSQWDHEFVYFTKSGLWVKWSCSQYDSVPSTYEEIDEADAIVWLSRMSCQDDSEFELLPEKIRSAVNEGINALEM